MYKHLEQFFKDTCILSVRCINTLKSCTAYNRWTSPSHRGDHFCVGITFAVVQAMQINVAWLHSFVQGQLKHRRRALFSYSARYDAIEFSNFHTEERSEAEMVSYRAL